MACIRIAFSTNNSFLIIISIDCDRTVYICSKFSGSNIHASNRNDTHIIWMCGVDNILIGKVPRQILLFLSILFFDWVDFFVHFFLFLFVLENVEHMHTHTRSPAIVINSFVLCIYHCCLNRISILFIYVYA